MTGETTERIGGAQAGGVCGPVQPIGVHGQREHIATWEAEAARHAEDTG